MNDQTKQEASQPVQQPAAVAGQEPVAYLHESPDKNRSYVSKMAEVFSFPNDADYNKQFEGWTVTPLIAATNSSNARHEPVQIVYGPSKSVFWGGHESTDYEAEPMMVLVKYDDFLRLQPYTAPIPAAGVQGDKELAQCKSALATVNEVLSKALGVGVDNTLRELLWLAEGRLKQQAAIAQPDSGRDAALVEALQLALTELRSCEPMFSRKYGIFERAKQHDAAIDAVQAALAAHPANGALAGLSDAARDVLAERRRQIEKEGFVPEDDDAYAFGELRSAALCYISGDTKSGWPWDKEWWKPTDGRRDLIKAGALVIAEIERLDRLAAAKKGGAA